MSELQRIDNNLEGATLDLLASTVREHFDTITDSDGFNFVEMDRAVSDLFELTDRLTPYDVAIRIGAIATKMFMVDLREVAKQVAMILHWGQQHGILAFDVAGEWRLKRYDVTYIPTRSGWHDARLQLPTTRMSKEGLMSRERKYRVRRRKAEIDFVFRLIDDFVQALPSDLPLSDQAAEFVFPCKSIGAFKANIEDTKPGLMLWQAVRLQWSLDKMFYDEMIAPLALVDFSLV